MGLKTLYTEVINKLKSLKNTDGSDLFKYVGVFNNQVRRLRNSSNDVIQTQYPACYVQIDVIEQEQLGLLHQQWEVHTTLHIIDDFYNNEDIQNEDNLRIFDITDRVWQNIQGTGFSNTSTFTNIVNEQEFDHDNLYHFTQTYKHKLMQIKTDDSLYICGVTLNISGITFEEEL